MIVDCDTCQVRGPACGDCVVTVLLGMPAPERPVELDDAERTAIGVLSGSGLVPPLRLVAGGAGSAAASPRTPDGGRTAAPDPREATGA